MNDIDFGVHPCLTVLFGDVHYYKGRCLYFQLFDYIF